MKAKEGTGRGNWPNIAFGLFLVGISLLVLIDTRGLRMGTTTEMGAGFMPKVLAGILGVCGLLTIARNVLKPGERIAAIKARSLLFVASSFAAFALLLPTFGVVIATAVMTFLAMQAGEERKPLELILYPVGLAIVTTLAFAVALRLPMPIWPTFF